MEKNDFCQCLDNIASASEDIQNQCRSIIIDMRTNNTVLFFNLVFQVFGDENPSLSRIIICLSAIRDMLIVRELSLSQVTKNWFSDFMSEIRVPLKNFIIAFVHNEDISIRNVSASVFALIFAIERKKIVENLWPQAISKLVDEFISENTIPYYKHGIMTFFHELMILPYFQEKIKKKDDFVQFIGPEIQRFLFQLIRNLEIPESNPKDVFDYSILCIYDLIAYIPESFDGEKEITLLLNSYKSALPMTDPVQYQQLFEVLYQIIVNFYEHISVFMEAIFNLSSKGIDCPNDELVCISIEFWIQFTRYEVTKDADENKYFTRDAIDPLIKLLLTVISQNKENTFRQSINLLRILSRNYTEKTVNISKPIIKSLINNDKDMIGVFVSLALIKGICWGKSFYFNEFIEFFERICYLINLGFSEEGKIDVLIPISAIWAANRMIISCRQIAEDPEIGSSTFDFILYLFRNPSLNPNFVNPILQLTISLFNSTTGDLIEKYFNDFFEILFSLLDNSSMIIDEETLNSNFSALKYLVFRLRKKDTKLQDLYPKVSEKMDEYMSLLERSSEDFHEIKLNQILELINIFITKLSDDFQPFAQSLITDSLIPCSRQFKYLTLESILIVLSSLCLQLKNKLFDCSKFIVEFITTGFAQDPSIISLTFALCADFLINVNNSEVELIEQMFYLVDPSPDQVGTTIPLDQIQMVIPSFMKQFARMFLKIKFKLGDIRNGDFIWPEEILNRFYIIVDKQIENRQLSAEYESNSQNFNYYNAARIYEGYFYAYAAYYKYQDATQDNYKKAVNIIIGKVILQCKNTKAFDCHTAIALCKLVKKLFKKYKNTIVLKLNNKNIKYILKNNPEYMHDDKFTEKIDKTLDFIQNMTIK